MPKIDSSEPLNSQQPNLLITLIRGAGAALIVQIVSVETGYAAQILLARWMGVTEYGVYDLAIAFSLSLAFIAGLGLPTAILRFIPEYRVKQDWAHLRGILRSSCRQTWIASLLLAMVSIIALDSASKDCWIRDDVLPSPSSVSQFCSLSRRCFQSTMLPDPIEVTHY